MTSRWHSSTFPSMKIILAGLTALLMLSCPINLHAQQAHILKGTVTHMADKKVELLVYYGEQNRSVSSTTVNEKGLFQFPFDDESPVGMYRLRFEEGRHVDVIYNREDIELSISKPNVQEGRYSLFDGIDVLSSSENRLYYDFLQTLDLRRKRIHHLNQLKLLYSPSKDVVKVPPDKETKGMREAGSFRGQVETELAKLHKVFERYIDTLVDSNPNSYAARIIKTMKIPVLDVKVSGDVLKEWQKEHFWNKVDLSDATLLYSPVIPSKVFEYISLYADNQLSREGQEMAFIEAVDDILIKAKADDAVFRVVLDVVIRKFEKSEYEQVLTYIMENYFLYESGCKDSEALVSADRTGELRKRVEIIKIMAVGNTAPEIEMPQQGIFDPNVAEGTVVPASSTQMKLSNIIAENTLVLFWASWCPHCTVLLSELRSVYGGYRDKGLEILAISIDEERIAWQSAISERQYTWINYSELTGWEGKAAQDYGVWSTPRMYLLDSEKKIVAKPRTIKELVVSITQQKPARTE